MIVCRGWNLTSFRLQSGTKIQYPLQGGASRKAQRNAGSEKAALPTPGAQGRRIQNEAVPFLRDRPHTNAILRIRPLVAQAPA